MPKKMRKALLLFYADQVLAPKAPATRGVVIEFLKKARHRHVDSAQFGSRKITFLVKAIGKHKSALAIALSLVALTPTRAEACSSEWFAVSRILGEGTPGDSLARQAYEMRKSRAWADLNACQKRERQEKRQKLEDAQRQQAYAQERQRLEQERTRADIAARTQAVTDEANRQANANLLATISTAILEGRCEESKTVALTNSRLDLADQAMRLCKPGVRKPASATPQPTPKPTPATTSAPAKNVPSSPPKFINDLQRPVGGKACWYEKGRVRCP